MGVYWPAKSAVKPVQFSEWEDVLARSGIAERTRRSYRIIINWYLSFCRRGRGDVTVQSAREFVEWAVASKKPQVWQLEGWKEALNWFFREAKRSKEDSADGKSRRSKRRERRDSKSEDGGAVEETVWLPPGNAFPDWKRRFLTTLRRRRYSYRTEQSYLVWIERFARQTGRRDLEGLGEAEIAAFLDELALDHRLSASSQRQALNALVFLYREVFERDLGDFSDYRRAKVRPHARTWLNADELEALFDQMTEPW